MTHSRKAPAKGHACATSSMHAMTATSHTATHGVLWLVLNMNEEVVKRADPVCNDVAKLAASVAESCCKPVQAQRPGDRAS